LVPIESAYMRLPISPLRNLAPFRRYCRFLHTRGKDGLLDITRAFKVSIRGLPEERRTPGRPRHTRLHTLELESDLQPHKLGLNSERGFATVALSTLATIG